MSWGGIRRLPEETFRTVGTSQAALFRFCSRRLVPPPRSRIRPCPVCAFRAPRRILYIALAGHFSPISWKTAPSAETCGRSIERVCAFGFQPVAGAGVGLAVVAGGVKERVADDHPAAPGGCVRPLAVTGTDFGPACAVFPRQVGDGELALAIPLGGPVVFVRRELSIRTGRDVNFDAITRDEGRTQGKLAHGNDGTGAHVDRCASVLGADTAWPPCTAVKIDLDDQAELVGPFAERLGLGITLWTEGEDGVAPSASTRAPRVVPDDPVDGNPRRAKLWQVVEPPGHALSEALGFAMYVGAEVRARPSAAGVAGR